MKLIKFTAIGTALFAMCACGSAQKADAATESESSMEATETVEATNDLAVQEVKPGQEITATPAVIDFNATWCGPCRQFKPVFDKVAEEYKGKITFYSVDVDSCPDLAKQFNVTAIPQITMILPDGTQKTQVGSMDEEQFKAFLSDLVAE